MARVERLDNVGSGSCEGLLGNLWEILRVSRALISESNKRALISESVGVAVVDNGVSAICFT